MRSVHRLTPLLAKAVLAAGGDIAKAADVLGTTEERLRSRAEQSEELSVRPDAPREITGQAAIADALSRSIAWVKDHLRGDDPIPARYTLRGITVRRDRLELWVKRFGKHVVPVEELGVLRGRPAIAKALGISEPSLKLYMKPTAPFGRVPVYKHGGVCWAYRDALVDFLDSQKMGLVVGRMLRGSGKVRMEMGED